MRSTAKTDGVCRIDEPRSLDSVEVFDPESATCQPVASLLQPREGHEAVRLGDGSVVLVGGLGDYG